MSSSLVERFAGEHFTLNSISERRQGQVLAALGRLEEFLSKPPECANDDDLRRWLVFLLQEGLAPSTVSLHLQMVASFYRWCWQRREIGAEEYMRIRDVSAPRGSGQNAPRPYSRKELARMWVELDARYPRLPPAVLPGDGRHRIARWRNGTSPYRNVKKHFMRVQLDAIIELALVCGLRRVEIYRLSIDDVHPDNKYIVVHGKRHDQNPKVRDVPYPDSTREAIREWFKLRGYLGAQSDCIWLSVTGPDPTAAMTWPRMARVMNSFGHWELHRLRHTCATERLRAGMSLIEVQKFLGHADVSMTQRYLGLLRSDIHRASERTDDAFQQAIRPAA